MDDPPGDDSLAAARDVMIERLLPHFIDAAGGDTVLARSMIADQIDSYRAVSVPDVLRVGRIIGLRAAAVGSLRLSMDPREDAQACWRLAASLSQEADRVLRMLTMGSTMPMTASHDQA